MKCRGWLALAGLAAAGNDPDVLHGAAAQNPADVQFAGRGGRLAVSAGSGPLQVPGAHELPEQHQLADVLIGRAGNVQGVDEPVIRPGGLRWDRHHCSSLCRAAGKPPARQVCAYPRPMDNALSL